MRIASASAGAVVATFSTSGGWLRNAMPEPGGQQDGKEDRPEDRFGLAHELAHADQRELDQRMADDARARAGGRGRAGERASLIAQMPSRQRHEHVLERGGSRAQLGQRQALPRPAPRAGRAPPGAAPRPARARRHRPRCTSRTPGSRANARRGPAAGRRAPVENSTTCSTPIDAISSRGVPRAMTTPWSMIATRSQSCSASSM